MTMPTAAGLNPQHIVAERDFTFGMESKEEPKEKPSPGKDLKTESLVGVKPKLLPVRMFQYLVEVLSRLRAILGTTSFRDHRVIITPNPHILQESHT